MKISGRTVSTPTPRADWNQTDPSKADYILNKPTEMEAVRGYSAYQVAVMNGFEGTEEEWLESLNGETPYIGTNGNWWIGETDTGVLAGQQGPVIPGGILYGDVNGDGEINARDARLILRYIAGEITEAELRLEVADVNADGVVDATDAELIEQYSAELITGFDAGKYANWLTDGEYWYYDLTVGGIAEGMTVTLLAPGVEIVKTECMDGYIRLFVTEPPKEDVPYSISNDIVAYGTEDLTAGESELETGKLYLVYE